MYKKEVKRQGRAEERHAGTRKAVGGVERSVYGREGERVLGEGRRLRHGVQLHLSVLALDPRQACQPQRGVPPLVAVLLVDLVAHAIDHVGVDILEELRQEPMRYPSTRAWLETVERSG